MEDTNRQPEADQPDKDEIVIPVVEEELDASTRAVKTGSVRVDKHVEKRIRKVETPLIHEDVEIRRVPVNRVITEMPKMRRDRDSVVIPVVEEEVIVTKRLVLKEEIHLIKHRTSDRAVQEVELNRESAEIRRLDDQGRVIDTPDTRPARDSVLRRRPATGRIVGSRSRPTS